MAARRPVGLALGGVGLLERTPVRARRGSFGRAIEARLAELKRGRQVVEQLGAHRVTVVKVLRHADGRRAVAALLSSLRDSVTTDDVLAHTVTAADVANVKRLAKVVQRVGGDDAKPLLDLAQRLAGKAEGGNAPQAAGLTTTGGGPRRGS